MFTETMALISIAMLAMMFYNISYLRFLAPLWIILYVVLSGRAVTSYGLFTIIVFAVLLVFFVLEAIRVTRKKAEKNRDEDEDEDEDSVSIFNEDENEDEGLSSLSSTSASDEESPKKKPKPKRTKITQYEGTLLSHGFAPYNDIIGNDKSYFVNCDGKTVWGIGLKAAIKNCGAQNGDTIRFHKEGEVRTKKAIIYDEKGKKTGTRNLSQDKRRGVWVMEVVSD